MNLFKNVLLKPIVLSFIDILDLLINLHRTCNGQIISQESKKIPGMQIHIGNNLHGREIVKVCSMILVEKVTENSRQETADFFSFFKKCASNSYVQIIQTTIK